MTNHDQKKAKYLEDVEKIFPALYGFLPKPLRWFLAPLKWGLIKMAPLDEAERKESQRAGVKAGINIIAVVIFLVVFVGISRFFSPG